MTFEEFTAGHEARTSAEAEFQSFTLENTDWTWPTVVLPEYSGGLQDAWSPVYDDLVALGASVDVIRGGRRVFCAYAFRTKNLVSFNEYLANCYDPRAKSDSYYIMDPAAPVFAETSQIIDYMNAQSAAKGWSETTLKNAIRRATGDFYQYSTSWRVGYGNQKRWAGQ